MTLRQAYNRRKSYSTSSTSPTQPSDLVVITGDVLDRHLSSLPDAVNGLKGLRAPLGVFAVLGNHDFADPFSYSSQVRGGLHISTGLQSAGIQTLRNQVVHLGSGRDRLALMGLDWLTSSPGDRNFFRYRPVETRGQLRRMAQEVGRAPRILLFIRHLSGRACRNRPDTLRAHSRGRTGDPGLCERSPDWDCDAAVQILERPLPRAGSLSLCVNRGIGYLGIPIRINCPPEISRFKLMQPVAI